MPLVFCDLFGRDDVAVFLFEEFKENWPGYVRSVAGFLGIDEAESLSLIRKNRENPRWTVRQVEKLKQIERSPLQSFLFRRMYRPWRRKALGFFEGHSLSGGAKATDQFSTEWIEKIQDVTRAGNRWLAKEWGLPLERYGYPL